MTTDATDRGDSSWKIVLFKIIESFSGRLRNQVDLDFLGRADDVANQTMEPTRSRCGLDLPTRFLARTRSENDRLPGPTEPESVPRALVNQGGSSGKTLQRGGFLRARECRRVEAICATWPNVLHDLGGSGPMVTVVVRCDPVIRGPDVAPMWPRSSRAWKARPGTHSMPGAMSMAQVRSSCSRPLLSVRDRQMPMLRARGGRGR
jgi:hypothetical protein